MSVGVYGRIVDFATISGLAVGLVGLGVAYDQNRVAKAAAKKVVGVEQHLAQQRWQQLRSIGDLIDLLEKDGRHEHNADYAAARASLKQQYGTVLATLAAATPAFSAHLLRGWIENGRLSRPWQIVEAMTHLPDSRADQQHNYDWLKERLGAQAPAESVKAVSIPSKLGRSEAAYILCVNDNRDFINNLLLQDSGHSAAVMVFVMQLQAQDRCRLRPPINGYDCWGTAEKKPIAEIFGHYNGFEFYVIHAAAESSKQKIRLFADHFEDYNCLQPKDSALERVRVEFPDLI